MGEGIVGNFGESLEISGGVSGKVKELQTPEGKLGDHSQDPADFTFCELLISLP